jgi:hypothetical protein
MTPRDVSRALPRASSAFKPTAVGTMVAVAGCVPHGACKCSAWQHHSGPRLSLHVVITCQRSRYDWTRALLRTLYSSFPTGNGPAWSPFVVRSRHVGSPDPFQVW